jgi:hypothetical protein
VRGRDLRGGYRMRIVQVDPDDSRSRPPILVGYISYSEWTRSVTNMWLGLWVLIIGSLAFVATACGVTPQAVAIDN